MNTVSSLLKNLRNRTPVGTIQMYGGSTAPTDWLICDGRAVSRSTYAALFSIIGTTYGGGNGSTTFNLPDMRDRVPVGAGSSYNLNASGGAASRSITPSGTIGGTKLSDAQIAHGHNFTQPTVPKHSHGLTAPVVPPHSLSFTPPTVPKHSHPFTQPTIGGGETTTSNTSKTLTGSFSSRKYGVPAKRSFWSSGIMSYDDSSASIVDTTGESGSTTANRDIVKIDATHTHTIPNHSHTAINGKVEEKAAFATTGGSVSQSGNITTTGGAVQEKAAFATTGGSVANLSGASSTRTTHTHTWTGSATTVDIRQPYRGINFIIYAGK